MVASEYARKENFGVLIIRASMGSAHLLATELKKPHLEKETGLQTKEWGGNREQTNQMSTYKEREPKVKSSGLKAQDLNRERVKRRELLAGSVWICTVIEKKWTGKNLGWE